MGFASLLPVVTRSRGNEPFNSENASVSFSTSSACCVAQYQCECVGRHFYSKRIRHSWTLNLKRKKSCEAETLRLEVVHSRLSGRKRVHIDGIEVFQTRARQLSWSLTHASGAEISVRSYGQGFCMGCHEPQSDARTRIAEAGKELDIALKSLEDYVMADAAETICPPSMPEEEFDVPRIWKLLAMPANLVSSNAINGQDAESCKLCQAPPMGSEHCDALSPSQHWNTSPASFTAKLNARDCAVIPSVASTPRNPRDHTCATQELSLMPGNANEVNIELLGQGADDVMEGNLQDPCLMRELHQMPGLPLPGSIDDGCQPCSERDRLLKELATKDRRVEALRRCLSRFQKTDDGALVGSIQRMEELRSARFESVAAKAESEQRIATICVPKQRALFGISADARCKRLVAELPPPRPGRRTESASRPSALKRPMLLPMPSMNTPHRTGFQSMDVPESAGQLPQPFAQIQTQDNLSKLTTFNNVALSPPHACRHSDNSLAQILILPKPKLLQRVVQHS
eukprot:TRINITY_DN8222_c0_g3_i1.p1 TRINITY_DN8222_c0_g3~~TRINITY_DN8222_c0_g3_i1.p1  ORF type:complete len:515 (-),score=79.98 TRINITY_DN8222_c0_g3_i1:181-1725(-)